MSIPGAIAPSGVKFSFWSSMADLVRLVLRSKAKGLKTRLAIALTLVLIGKWTGVIAPLFIKNGIDRLNHGHSLPQTILTGFVAYALGSTALRFIANTAPYMRDSIFQPVSQMALARSAVETFAHSLSLSLDFHQGKQTGGLSRIIDRGARSTDTLLRSVVFNLGPTVIELTMAAWVLTANFDARLAAVAIATIIIYIILTFSISNWRIKYRRAWNEADSYVAGLAVDALMNYETVKTFGSETRTVGQYEDAMTSYAQAAVKANTSLQLLNAVQSIVLNLGYASIVCLAGYLYVTDPTHMSIGGITACILILQQVYQPLNMLGSNYREIRQAFIDMEQMINLRAIQPDITDAPDAVDLPPASAKGAELVFEHVEFQHTARSVGLAQVDFRISPGTTTALVGPSGAGKTTIVRLALRLLDPQGGAVKLDGVDLRRVRIASLRRAIALVPQDVALFNDTLYANIAFARPEADESEVWAAAEAAELSKFIETLPYKMQTRVGERGLKLSGGQRQRVAIAQAMAKHAPILVLDEATSALDSESEYLVQEALWRLMESSTALVIAHRLSTIATMDRIIVFDQGTIVEEGTHQELLAPGGHGMYGRLWRHQSGGFLVEG
jgi:ATP-binding cassette, subfamily B, heavy metal transporter